MNSKKPQNKIEIPILNSKVEAGFPTFIEEQVEDKMDLNKYLIKHPSATYFVRVSGDSMIDAGIHDNDILIVDRSISPSNGKIVIAAIDGFLTVKRLVNRNGKIFLLAENKKFSPIEISLESDLHIWGVVTSVIHIL